jgi:hypothetical protein
MSSGIGMVMPNDEFLLTLLHDDMNHVLVFRCRTLLMVILDDKVLLLPHLFTQYESCSFFSGVEPCRPPSGIPASFRNGFRPIDITRIHTKQATVNPLPTSLEKGGEVK